MSNMEQDMKKYLAKNVFMLGQMKQILLSQNRVFSLSASSGDVVSASMLLNNNILLSGIDILLNDPMVEFTKEEEVNQDELFGVADKDANLGKLN